MTDRRIIDLQEGLSDDAYLLTDSVTNGTKKYAVSDMIDKAANEALGEVSQITSEASSAAAQATDAKNAAQAATTAANNAANAANDATTAANAAIDAIGDISELAVPLISENTRGGAKLGNGLQVTDEKLSLGNLIKSGDGSYVDGCAIVDVKAEGWAEQDSTMGKNLFTFEDITNTSDTWIGLARKINGSEIKLSGTTSNTYIILTYDTPKDISGDVVLTFIVEGTAPRYAFRLRFSDESILQLDVHEGEGTYTLTKTIPSGVTIIGYTIEGLTSGAVYDMILRIQLEAGDTATEYEPYTGGAPSPSPNYPQEIRVARGRNLLDSTKYPQLPYTSASVTFSDNGDGGIALSGTPTGVSAIVCTGIEISEGKHILSLSGNCTNTQLQIFLYDADESILLNRENITTSFAFDTADYPTAKTANVVIKQRITGEAMTGVAYVQLELGSIPTPYVPYGHVGLELQSLSQNQDDWVNRGITDSTGIPSQTASVTTRVSNTLNDRFDNVAQGNEYVLTWNGSNIQTAIYAYDGEGNYIIGESSYSWHSSPFTLAFTNAQKVRVVARKSDNSVITPAEVIAANVRLVSCTPIPLPSKGWAGGLPDGTADMLTLDSAGRWEWENATAEEVFDGVANVLKTGTVYGDNVRTIAELNGKATVGTDATKRQNFYVSNFAVSLDPINNPDKAIAAYKAIMHESANGAFVVIPTADLASIDAAGVNSWLAAHNITVLYPLATPTTEHGYINLPVLPNGATVSIPELDNLNISWIIENCSPLIQMNQTAPHFQWVVDDNEDTWLAIIA